MSSMKLISARSRRAPAPMYTANRAPLNFVARSRSSIPSCSPTSQCGLGSKLYFFGSPQVLTTSLFASEVPFGTSSRVRFGIRASDSRIRPSSTPAVKSRSSSLAFKDRVSSTSGVASIPCFLSAPTSWLKSLRRALTVSACVIASRRAFSYKRKSPSKTAGSAPRARSFSSTNSRLDRTNPKSSMTV